MQQVFITGATGYIGSALIRRLYEYRDIFQITALVRKGSEHKLPEWCRHVQGDALDATTYQDKVPASCIFIHLVGVAHPSPSKKELFRKIDLVSIHEAVKASNHIGVDHFIYLSVAMFPNRLMRSFQLVRQEGEQLLMQQPFAKTFIRPWYVLGKGHWWPLILKPLYWLLKICPFDKLRKAAYALDTVYLRQLLRTIIRAMEEKPAGLAVYDVKDIKEF